MTEAPQDLQDQNDLSGLTREQLEANFKALLAEHKREKVGRQNDDQKLRAVIEGQEEVIRAMRKNLAWRGVQESTLGSRFYFTLTHLPFVGRYFERRLDQVFSMTEREVQRIERRVLRRASRH